MLQFTIYSLIIYNKLQNISLILAYCELGNILVESILGFRSRIAKNKTPSDHDVCLSIGSSVSQSKDSK